MKKVLEIVIDDDGKMKFLTEGGLGITKDLLSQDPEKISRKSLKKLEDMLKVVIKGLVDCYWKEGNEEICPIIRIISMADMMASPQPYAQVEQFWSMMMFSLIPNMEDYASDIKSKYGFNADDVDRPLTWVNPDIFVMGTEGNKWN